MMKRMISMMLCLLLMVGCLSAGAEEIPAAGPASGLNAFLEQQAAAEKDPWVQAILRSGAENVTMDGNTARFRLRSFDPGLKALGSYSKAADKAAWRQQALANVSAHGLELELTFEADGSVSAKQAKKLLTAIRQAAKSAKAAFSKKEFTACFTDMLFPMPATGKKPAASDLMAADADFAAAITARPDIFPCESASEWAPLLYVQRNWKYTSGKTGPHAITLTWDGIDPVRLLNQAYDSASSSLAAEPAATRAKEDSLPYLWRSSLAQTAITAKKGKLSSYKLVFDIDELIRGEMAVEYSAYFAKYIPAAYYNELVEGYRLLPDAASQPLPKTGIISATVKKGRRVMIKVPKDGRYTYVQLRDADTHVIQSEAFVEPGKNLNMVVPEGVYVVQYATGSTWYGTEGLFGPLGNYTISDDFIVAKKKWTLVPEEEQPGIVIHESTIEAFGEVEDKSIHLQGILQPDIELKEAYPENNPVIPGVSSTTGMAASGETYTPIIMVLDNAEDAYPHWGVRNADFIFQIPNGGSGATKLLALFADHYPDEAGPVRSGRSSMLPAALSFNAAFAFAGPPIARGTNVALLDVMTDFGMTQSHRVYNLLRNNGFSHRVKGGGGHNLSCYISMIHDNLINQSVVFEERPFLFTDEPRTEGESAPIVKVLHRGEDPTSGSNSASRAVFKYNEDLNAYTRTNSSGVYIDRDTGETIPFANVLVLRTQFSYESNAVYLTRHLVGTGSLEIFQNGKYVRGAWKRDSIGGRLILIDADGEELQLQRGKTFMVMTNDVSNVIYSE